MFHIFHNGCIDVQVSPPLSAIPPDFFCLLFSPKLLEMHIYLPDGKKLNFLIM